MYKYFIVYRLTDNNGSTGTSRTEIEIDSPITSLDVIAAIEHKIKNTMGHKSVCITFWRKFEE